MMEFDFEEKIKKISKNMKFDFALGLIRNGLLLVLSIFILDFILYDTDIIGNTIILVYDNTTLYNLLFLAFVFIVQIIKSINRFYIKLPEVDIKFKLEFVRAGGFIISSVIGLFGIFVIYFSEGFWFILNLIKLGSFLLGLLIIASLTTVIILKIIILVKINNKLKKS
jgi:hypothetical protein